LRLQTAGITSIQIRDISGKLVFETAEFRQAGQHHFDIPAGSLQNSGFYICQVQIDGKISSQKLLRL